MTTDCRHPLCELIGSGCSIAANRSRGCRPGSFEKSVSTAVFDEIRALLAAIEARDERSHAAAVRLAQIIRGEAREDRHLVAHARSDEPELADSLARLCVRRA